MKNLKFAFLLLGLVLLGFIIQETSLEEVWRHVAEVEWSGVLFVLALYTATFLTDVAAWRLTFESIPLNARWLSRLYLVRIVGEAFNKITPLASMGGEPIKVLILRSYYGIKYRESSASLVLAKTTDMMGLVLFLSVGFALLIASEALKGPYKAVAGLGLAAFSVSIALFFLVQWFQITSLAGRWLGGSKFAPRLEGWLQILREIDDRLLRFYTLHRVRFGAALGLAITSWLLGVVEVYYIMRFLGHPVTLGEAWIIEAMAQLVRAGTFFIPSSIGAQEATFVLICASITGNPSLGLAASLVRRVREILWILMGLALWGWYSLKPGLVEDQGPATALDTSAS